MVGMLPGELFTVPMFSTRAARQAGVTDLDLRAGVRDQSVVRLKRGWYTAQVLTWPDDRHRLRVLIELAERDGVVPSHYSAAVHLRLPVHRPDWGVVHLTRTSPGHGQRRSGLVIHQQVAGATELTSALAIAQTGLLCQESGLMAYDAALRTGTVTPTELVRAIELHHDRPGFSRLAILPELGDGRRESPLESRTALSLFRLGWRLDPQFQVPGTRYRADGRITRTRLLIECDGKGKYDRPGALFEEKVREDELRALNWQVVRVTDDLLNQPKALFERVRAALRQADQR